MYKVYNDIFLTENEKRYLEAWKKAMNDSNTLINDCLVPKNHSKKDINSVSEQDLNTLNELSLVEISAK